MATSDDESDSRTRRLLARIAERAGVPIPTSSLGRLRRTATTALRGGMAQLLGRLAGGEAFDARAIERIVLSLGELKGIAMKVGQILSYGDAPLRTPEARELLAVLQRRAQGMPFAVVEATLRAELGARAAGGSGRGDRRGARAVPGGVRLRARALPPAAVRGDLPRPPLHRDPRGVRGVVLAARTHHPL